MKKLNRKGFTLIELLAVIVVTSLVLGLSGYGIISAYNSSKEKSLVLNETSVFQAARIYSSEANSSSWKEFENVQYFCTTIQRLKNAGLLKKEATSNSEEFDDNTLITVERDSKTFNVQNIVFVEADNAEIRNLCNIKFFTIHYEYNVENENGKVPNDQIGEVCTSDNCSGINISSMKPKRNLFRFVGWNTEADGSGTGYNAGSYIENYGEGTITLYAQWEEDFYTIKYDGNGSDITGSTPDTKCYRNMNCTLSPNGFIKNGYEFAGWNTKSDNSGTSYNNEQIVNNITSSNTITLYAKWRPKYKAIIKFNVGNNGQIRNSTTSSSGVVYKWRTDANGIISRSKNNGGYYDDFFTIPYENSNDLPNYNNDEYMYITNSFYSVSSGSVWKCTTGNECLGRVYNQTDSYNSNDFCDASSGDCTVVLTVNWENKDLLSPIIVPSDGIASGQWHNTSYNLTITSENSGSVSYEYKVGNGSYQGYNSAIIPPEGVNTYTARTKVGSNYSGEVSYVSKLDMTPPSVPVIDNPTNGEWTNQDFSLTLHSTDALSGIAYYQWSYDTSADNNKNWNTYSNSALNDFVTTAFAVPRNQKVFVRACDYAENCSASSSTYIRIDKTDPSVDFTMKNGNTIVKPSENKYSLDHSTVPSWINFSPTLIWKTSDLDSGINVNLENNFSYNAAGQSILVTDNIGVATINGDESGQFMYTLTSAGYRYIGLKVCDNAGNCVNSNVYARIDKAAPDVPTITNPTNGNWTKNNFSLTLRSNDILSGIAYYQYKYTNTNWTTYNNSSSTNFETTPFSAERNELVYERACDNAGNCSDAATTYIRIDKTAPTVAFEMLDNGSTVASNSNYYSNSPSNNLRWFTFAPTLKWNVSDGGSGTKNTATYHSNPSSIETLNENLTQNDTLSKTTSNNYFSLVVPAGGYRKYKITVCDNVDNCADNTEYFKYYSNGPISRYVNVSSYLNCWNNFQKGSSIQQYRCGTVLNPIVKTYTKTSSGSDWYYNVNANCYVDGRYLVASNPSCSSGGGGETPVGNCGACTRDSQCTLNGAEGQCYNGHCRYQDASGNWSMCS